MSETIDVVTAFDQQLITTVPLSDEAVIMAKLDRAEACLKNRDGWLKPHERIARLKKLAALVAAEADEFAMLIAREGGKPLTDAKVEVARAINGIELAAEEIAHLRGTEIAMGLTPASDHRKAWTTKEPIGIVVAVSAFNHPLNLIVHQVAPALATGCPVLVKPASSTPLSCIRFVELAHEAGFSEDWVQLAVCKNDVATKMVTDPRVAFFSFIGSARVGWMLRGQLAPGTRCALEHGGVAPVIVDQQADIDALINPLVKGGYYHAGQVCVSVQRIYVHDAVFDEFADKFVARVGRVKTGDPTLADTESGPLISPSEVTRVHTWVQEAVDKGAILACGGDVISDTTYQPTVLINPPADCTISTHEVFGPVTCLYRYSDLDEAIDAANSLDVAFQAAIFSRDINTAMYAGERLDASAVMINDHTAFRVDWMPFAGRRASGHGIGGIPYTMEDMVQDKMYVFNLG